MTDLGDLGFNYSYALALNSTGTEIVGNARVGMSDHAMVWSGGAMKDLNALVRNGAGWLLTSATGGDDTGVITGYGSYHGAQHAFLLTPENAREGRRRAAR